MPDRYPQDEPVGALIESADRLADVCHALSRVERFGFDVEFVAEDAYTAHACLVQVATERDVWLIDALADLDLRPFWELIACPDVEKVVHAGLEDLAMSFTQTGLCPRNIFDVQIAAGLVGLDYPMSLQRLARTLVGARLHKSQTLTDWRKRPLAPEQLRYAINDVIHLLPIRARIGAQLAARQRLGWAEEEFARFSDERTYQVDKQELFWRVKGVGALDRRGLAVMRELAVERDKLAKTLDRPARAVLKDHLMIAIARHGLAQRDKLRSLRGLNLRSRSLDELAAAVRRGLESPPDRWPRQPDAEDDTPQETTLRKLVSAVLANYCHQEGIAVQLLASNRDVRALVLAHTRNGARMRPGLLQRGWRKEAIGQLVDEVLSGRRCVRVANDDAGPRLTIE